MPKNRVKIFLLLVLSVFSSLSAFAETRTVLTPAAPTDKTLELPKIQSLDSKAYPYPVGKEKLFVLLWATWCSECKEKLTKILPLNKDNPRIHILALNTEKNLKKVSAFLADEKITLPVAVDLDRNFRKTFSLLTVPSWAAFERVGTSGWKLIDKGDSINQEKIKTALGEAIL